MRHDESDELLNDLLRRWHRYAATFGPAIGYPTTNAACRLYRVSRQYDDQNSALDGDLEAQTLRAVGYAIDRLEQPWRTAVHFNARNLATGVVVWQSPRLPVDELERAHLLMHARAKLLILLESDGIA